MVIIREARKKPDYKNSREAFYEVEAGNPNETVKVNDGKRKFEWHRQKSNANVLEKGFSFYFARKVFEDKYWLMDSSIASDPDNTAIFGVIRGDTDVMVVIYTDSASLDKGIVRIVSAYYPTNQKLAVKYRRARKLREFCEPDSPEEVARLEAEAEETRKIIEAHKKKMNFRINYDNEKGWDRGW